ncbi:MAG: TRAP transporter small permease subunit [Rhodospirillaceae bacterium]|jgi:C4-dicarboxylate transporter, DctQ subunit|nr:TRAP transporter small permease subunit [Rhodospirillaceae bacterium]MBT5046906.1 TRAP transporter small permease subunit [Rhodospirillaceae bacterium]MBT5457812.1 TRAP transporter small permease subunit [Rhodospirillaceae bacterium]
MSAVVRGYNFILNGMAVIAGILIFASFVMIVVDVTMRITGLKPPSFTIAVVEYILLWFAMLAAPWLLRIKGHVFIDAVKQFLPGAVQKVIAKLVYSICIVSSSIYCYHASGLVYVTWTKEMIDVRSIDMPQWILFGPMPVCFFFLTIEFIRYLIGIDDMYSQSLAEREGV